MKHFKNIFFFYSSFSGKSGRIEFEIYLLINILTSITAIYLHENINLDNEKVLNFLRLLYYFIYIYPDTSRNNPKIT